EMLQDKERPTYERDTPRVQFFEQKARPLTVNLYVLRNTFRYCRNKHGCSDGYRGVDKRIHLREPHVSSCKRLPTESDAYATTSGKRIILKSIIDAKGIMLNKTKYYR